MAKFVAVSPPAPEGEQPAMDNQNHKSSSRTDEYGEDLFVLTENCDYPPSSKVSVESCFACRWN